jgi:hypothetical protein
MHVNDGNVECCLLSSLQINAEVVDEARRSLTIKEFTRIYGVG